MFCEVEEESAPDGAEEQEQVSEAMTPERQAIVNRLEAVIDEIRTAKDYVESLRRDAAKIEDELADYDKAVFVAATRGAA